MENQIHLSKTLTKDDPESFHSQESLDSDSFSGSSSFSLITADPAMEIVVNEETVAIPLFSDSPLNNHVFSFTSRPPSPSSTEPQPSQTLAVIHYDSKKPFDGQEQDQEDTYRWPYSNYNFPYRGRPMVYYDYQFNSPRENEFKPPGDRYSSWTPRLSRSLSPSKVFRTENEPTGVGAGLENLGNTCYINAVLQCLTHTVPFVLGLRSLNHYDKPCDRDIENFCLLCPLKDHIELSLNSSGGVVLPSKIFDNLNYISSCFRRYQQEDAHEFLQCLFNRLESCCSDSTPKNDSLISPDDCLVKKVFGGHLVSRLCCCNCGHISYSYESLNDLSLEIENVDTLPSALSSFTKVEKIEAKVRCGNCKEKVSAEKQLMLDQAPSVAIFHLKRFKTEGTFVEKIDKHLAFPLELDLQPYTIANHTSNGELKYELYAVVKHSGLRPTSGHYICYIRSSPYRWHELNDSMVTSVEEEIVLSQEAYILFYSRQDIPWFSTAIDVQKPCARHSAFSPKSVLDCIERASKAHLESSATANCGLNVEKISTKFSCETQFELELDEPGVADEGVSGLPVNESELHASKSINSTDDNPMGDDSVPSGSNNCSDEFEKKYHLEQDNSNQDVDEATNDCSSAWMPSRSQRPCQRGSIGCGPCTCLKNERRGIHRRGVNGAAMDQGRIEGMRYDRRMPTERGSKFMVLLASLTGGKIKKRTGSSPCKRVSPRCRHDHNLKRSVPVSR